VEETVFQQNQPPKRMKNVRKGYYSPALRRDLVSRLYFKARDLGVPMTVLNDRIVEAALKCAVTTPFPPAGQSTKVVQPAA
jgi:hypothetical protein